MRLAFAGTPDFAAVALRALISAGHEVVLVLTQPDRPAGRGMKSVPSPIKQVAIGHGIATHQPASLKSPEAQAPLAVASVEVLVVAAYGLILPPALLRLPRHGCLNIHASLLPRWRGAAPIQRAILAGDAQTGVSIMQMEAGLDTGPVLLSSAVAITAEDTGGTLHDKLAQLGATLIVEALRKVAEGQLQPVPQSKEGVTYAEKLRKEEAEIDWREPAAVIERKVRAFDPFPVAHTRFRRESLRLWRAKAVGGNGSSPGQVVRADANGIVIACGEGVLTIKELQRAGGKRLSAASFLAGHRIVAGEVFG